MSLVWATCLLAEGEGPQDKQAKPPEGSDPLRGGCTALARGAEGTDLLGRLPTDLGGEGPRKC